jgi:tRNA A-37 threonylcarbamoyl transferase component Bud32
VDARRIAIDRQGFVWVSGARGTFRFDGIEFLPASRLGLPMGGTNQITVTSDGTVWAQATDRLWRLEGSQFINESAGRIQPEIEAAGEVLYAKVLNDKAGNLQVSYKEGAAWKQAEGPYVASNLRLFGEPDGRVWLGGRFAAGKPSTVAWIRFRNGVFEGGEEIVDLEMLPQREVVPAGTDSIFTARATGVNLFLRSESGHIKHAAQYISTLPVSARLLTGNREEVWYEACGKWLSSKGRSASLPGVVEVKADADGGLWGALGEHGIVFESVSNSVRTLSLPGMLDLPPMGMAIGPRRMATSIVSALPDRPVMGVSRHGRRLYIARQDVTAMIDESEVTARCDGTPSAEPAMKQWGQVGEDAPFTNLVADTDGSIWVLGEHQGAMHISADGKILKGPARVSPMFRSTMLQLAVSADGRLWVASKMNLLEVIRQPSPGYAPVFPEERYVSGFARDQVSNLVAISDGALLHYNGGQWREEALPSCLLSQKLHTAAIGLSGERWYGYRDTSGFTRAAPNGGTWSCEHFVERNGFPGDTKFLALDRKGRVWRGSSAGLHVRRGVAWVRVLAPDGEMRQLFHEEPDGSLLVAIGNRFLRVPSRLADADPGVPPGISYLESAGAIDLHPKMFSVQLGSGAVIHLSALPERELAASAPIEYRFDARGWRTLHGHALRLDEAPRDAARIEFRYSGSERVTAFRVSIAVPWWRSYWFYSAMTTLGLWIAAHAARFLRRRLYHFRKHRFVAASDPEPDRAAKPEPLQPGMLLRGRYRVEGLIAEGGFSHVFGALDETTGRKVVVKRLRTNNVPHERLRRRFAQEVAAISMVRHPGIVPITDTWIDSSMTPHLVLPRIDGPTLRERLRTGPFERSQALEFLGKLADILAAAHEQGVIHSDLKPENILVANGDPLIIDFGTSALQLSAGLSEYSKPAGSVHYMAPEQLLGRYSKATDVYSFASVALEVLTGRRYVNLDLPMSGQWEEEFRRLCAEELGLNGETAGTFVSGLRFDPAQREQSVDVWMKKLKTSA